MPAIEDAADELNCDFFLESKDYIKLLAQKKVLLPISVRNLYGYEGVILNILEICRLSKAKVHLIIYDDVNLNTRRRLLLLIKYRTIVRQTLTYCESFTEKFKDSVSVNFYSMQKSAQNSPVKSSYSVSQILKLCPELYRSIHATWFGRNWKTLSFHVKGPREKCSLRNEISKFNLGFTLIDELSRNNNYDFVFVPNGKYPDQVGIKYRSKTANFQILYFEHDNGRTFLQKFQTQNMKCMKSALRNWTKTLNSSEELKWINWADNWVLQQKTNSFQNQFLRHNSQFNISDKALKDHLDKIDKPLIVIFTSSIDERVSNLSIDLNGWASQGAAIVECAKKIKLDGFYPHVRLHPNMQWKSLRDLLEIIKFLEQINISYQLPWEGPDTYWLLEKSKSIVTWGSTVGLESMAMGIPTYNLGLSKYQDIVRIPTFTKSTLHRFNFNSPILPHVRKVKLAIFATKNYGLQDLIHTTLNNPHKKRIKLIKLLNKKSSFIMMINMIQNPLKSSSRDVFRVLAFFFGSFAAKKILVNLSRYIKL